MTGVALWYLVGQIIVKGSLVLSTIVLSRSLSVADFSTFAYVNLTIQTVSAYASIGITITSVRLFAAADRTSDAFVQDCQSILMYSLAGAFAGLLAIHLIPSLLFPRAVDVPLLATSVAVVVLALTGFSGGAVTGMQRYRAGMVVWSISGTCLLIFAGVAGYLQSAELAVWGVACSALIQVMGEMAIVATAVNLRRVFGYWRATRQSVFNQSVFLGPMSLVTLLASSGPWLVGQIIMRSEGGEFEFALYSIGLQCFAIGIFLPAIIGRVSEPLLARGFGADHIDAGVAATFTRSLLQISAAGVITALIGYAAGEQLLQAYGAHYSVGREFVGLYLLAALLASMTIMLGNAIVLSSNQWLWLGLIGVWLIVLIGVAVLLRSMGAWAAGIALCLSYAVLIMLATACVRWRVELQPGAVQHEAATSK